MVAVKENNIPEIRARMLDHHGLQSTVSYAAESHGFQVTDTFNRSSNNGELVGSTSLWSYFFDESAVAMRVLLDDFR